MLEDSKKSFLNKRIIRKLKKHIPILKELCGEMYELASRIHKPRHNFV